MWVYFGHTLVVTLDDGSTVRGKLGWSWRLGFWRLREPESLDGEVPAPLQGQLLVPVRRVLIVQVM